MKIFVLAAVLALAVALPVKRDALEKKIIQIVRSSSETNEDGSYSNSYTDELGTTVSESGRIVFVDAVDPDDETKTIKVPVMYKSGSHSYIGDDGKTYTMTWTADENGYNAVADYLPVAPAVPEVRRKRDTLEKKIIQIVRSSSETNEDGSYSNSYTDELGTTVSESGRIVFVDAVDPDDETKTIKVPVMYKSGSHSYIGDDGKTYTMTWTADENGYNAVADYLPVAPAVPEVRRKRDTLEKKIIQIVRSSSETNEDGSYSNSYTDELGTTVSESGRIVLVDGVDPDDETKTIKVPVMYKSGSHSYIGDDGKTYTMTWTSDENGYRAVADYLPVAPAVPEA